MASVSATLREGWHDRHNAAMRNANPCAAELIHAATCVACEIVAPHRIVVGEDGAWHLPSNISQHMEVLAGDPANALALHEEWTQNPNDVHPLVSLAATWIVSIPNSEAQPAHRPYAILPESLRVIHKVERTSQAVNVLGPQVVMLPDIVSVEEDEVVPLLPLDMGIGDMRKRGADEAKRLWWGAIALTDIAHREPDGSVRVKTTLRDLATMLYPGQRWRARELGRLRRAMEIVNTVLVTHERREWHIVHFEALPTEHTKLDDMLPVRVSLPPNSDRGPSVDRASLFRFGTVSGPVFDAWVRLNFIWDKAKLLNGKRRVYSHRPRVLRDDAGYLVTDNGSRILGRGGKPTRDWSDPRAIRDGVESNPAAEKVVPELDRRDLSRLFYGNAEPTPKRVDHAKHMLSHFDAHASVSARHQGRVLRGVRVVEKPPWLKDGV